MSNGVMALKADLNRSQRRIARKILQEGEQQHATRKQEKAALETGLVETNLSNPRGGLGTSAGWRQELNTYGSVGRRRNIRGAARRFYREAKQLDRPGLPAGQLAAAVQRPAAQYRGKYGQRSAEAEQILANNIGPLLQTQRTTFSMKGGQDFAQERRQALASYFLAKQGAEPLPGAPPAHSLLDLATTLGNLQDAPGTLVAHRKMTDLNFPNTFPARVSLASGADRAGVKTKPSLLRFARKVSGVAGEKLTIGTGTNHSRLTVNGNVSDHWTGHGGDIRARGKRLIKLGQAALIAAGMSPKQARKQRGGLYNVGRHQIIFNTHEGGDHTNHLHISG